MTKVITETQNLNSVGPYSLAIQKSNTLFCSGQIGIDRNNNLVDGGIEAEFKIIMKNIKEVLEKASFDLKNIVKVVIYVTDLKKYKLVNDICQESFEKPYPARVTVEVSNLPLAANIEIEVTAVKE